MLLLSYLPAPIKGSIKRELKEEILDIKKVHECLRNELITLGSDSASIKEVKHHTVNRFSIGEEEKENWKPQSKVCQGSNHLWFECRQYQNPESTVKRAQILRLCKWFLDPEHGKKMCAIIPRS